MSDLNINQFKENLAHFTGTEAYHKISIGKSCVTDGAKYVATQLGAFWLFDAISSHIEFGDMPEQDMAKYLRNKTLSLPTSLLSLLKYGHKESMESKVINGFTYYQVNTKHIRDEPRSWLIRDALGIV